MCRIFTDLNLGVDGCEIRRLPADDSAVVLLDVVLTSYDDCTDAFFLGHRDL